MNKFSHAIFLLCLLLPLNAQADWQTSMVRVLCMPEPGLEHFSVQPYPLKNLNESTENPADDNVNQKLDGYDLLDAQKFSYTCKLPGHSYQIYGSSEHVKDNEGRQNGNFCTYLSLKEDNKLLLHNVLLGATCTNNADEHPPYISEIVIHGSDRDSSTISVAISNGEITKSILVPWKYIGSATLNCLQKNGFFTMSETHEIAATCIDTMQVDPEFLKLLKPSPYAPNQKQ